MNDIYITLTGNVAAEPRQYSFDDGSRVTSLRVFSSHRYFDKKAGQWIDGDRVCFTVRCWRALGENVAASIRAGHPVVVSGKLRIREFGPEGDRRFVPEIEASAVGHDLRWGTGAFTKPDRSGNASMSKEMRDRLDEETRDWAMGTRSFRSLPRSGSTSESDPFYALSTDRTSGSHDAAPALAPERRSPGEDGSTVHTLSTEGNTAGSSGGEDDAMRSAGEENGTRRTPGMGEHTVRFLGPETDEKMSKASADEEEDSDAEEQLLEERVAA
ncbi:single-stranded DNA-binding protein [Nonomuraea sp. NPDC050153]|uniref:single-stranded DNA-binding protein n=1 Tax=Nonomuraea sp. NPDC050153 TaxID=3364359 RepID=UPI00378F0ABB